MEVKFFPIFWKYFQRYTFAKSKKINWISDLISIQALGEPSLKS